MKKFLGIFLFYFFWCNAASSHEGHTFKFMKSGFIYNDNGIVKYIDNFKYKKKGSIFKSTILKDYKINPDKTIILIFNHGMSGNKEKQCNWHNGIVNISKLTGQKIGDKEIKVFMNCEGMKVGGKRGFKKKKLMPLEEFIGDKPFINNSTYFNRKQKTLELISKLISEGMNPKNIFTSGQSWGGWNSLRIAAFNSELINSSIAFSPGCCDPKKNQKPGSNVAEEYKYFTYNLKSANKINALVFSSNADSFENPESLSFLKNIKGIKMIGLPGFEVGKKIIKINGKVCKWDTHDQNNKNLTDGHYIISSSCFEPYIQVIKEYIESRMN